MKRFTVFILLAAFLFAGAAPAMAELQDFWANVYRKTQDWQVNVGDMTQATSGITFKVLQQNSDSGETLYYYGGSTSLTNPVSTTNFASDTVCKDRVAFRTDPTDATYDRYVDLIVVDTVGGYTAFIEDFDPYTHTIVLDEVPGRLHHGLIWWTGSTAAETETDTGVDFTPDTMVKAVRVEVTTADSGETLNVGILASESGGDMDGFLDGISLTTAGYPTEVFATRGAFLDDGTDIYMMGKAITASAVSLSYSSSKGTDTGVGYIHYDFVRAR